MTSWPKFRKRESPSNICIYDCKYCTSFAGSGFRVSRDRGKPTATPWSEWWMASYHPSAILRAANDAERRALESTLREDLVLTRQALDAAAAM